MNNRKYIFLLAGFILILVLFGGTMFILNLSDESPRSEIPADSLYPGTYYLGTGINDPNGPSNYVLELRDDGTATTVVYPTDPSRPIETIQGTWTEEKDQAILLLTDSDVVSIEEPERIVFEYRDFFLVAVEHPYGDDEFEFTIGSGDEHPAVRQLHLRLAAVPWLEFQDPGPAGTVYDEETRRAVFDFQISQGLLPSGVVDQQTWDALENPSAPPPTMTPVPLPTNTEPAPTATETPVAEATSPMLELATPIPTATETPSQPADLPGAVSERPTHIDGQPVVYLTFDDGPSVYTSQFQELLKQYNAFGTFFVIGQQVNGSSAVADGAQSGYYQANHTFSHISLSGISFDQFSQEVSSSYQAIQNVTSGQDANRIKLLCLRPPYGATDGNTGSFASQLGYEIVLWDIDPQDWRQPGADQIAGHIINSVYPGAIVLMHDGGGYRDQSVQALGQILPALSQQGYRFESLCR